VPQLLVRRQGDSSSSDSLSRKTEIACWLVSLAHARSKDLHKDQSTVSYRVLAKPHAVSYSRPNKLDHTARGNTGVTSATVQITVKETNRI
jgi:hypothetical protein